MTIAPSTSVAAKCMPSPRIQALYRDNAGRAAPFRRRKRGIGRPGAREQGGGD